MPGNIFAGKTSRFIAQHLRPTLSKNALAGTIHFFYGLFINGFRNGHQLDRAFWSP
jgi:hypothetical protein